jgi:epoxyqueuosine reductase
VTLRDRIHAKTRDLGFSLFGVAPATDADGFDRFAAWLDAGYAGEMSYLHDHREQRRHPRGVWVPVKSVVMLGYDYGPPVGQPHVGKVAAYAQRRDYHRVIWDKLNELRDWLAAEVPGALSHGTCDSAPLLERDFARRAGLGWVGKNAMLLNKSRGSYFLLAGFLTSLELQPDAPQVGGHCGNCTACLTACPTGAFPEPGVVDATRCVSYLTIEARGAMPLELREAVGDRLFGCDDCQTACPWNRFAAANPDFPPDDDLLAIDPMELLSLNRTQFDRRFRGTPLIRARRAGLLRNACVVLGNTAGPEALLALRLAATDAEAVVAEAASWAVARIESRQA